MDGWARFPGRRGGSAGMHNKQQQQHTLSLLRSRLRKAPLLQKELGTVCLGTEQVRICACNAHPDPIAVVALAGSTRFTPLEHQHDKLHDESEDLVTQASGFAGLATAAVLADFPQPGMWLSLDANTLKLVDCHRQSEKPLFPIVQQREARDWIAAADAHTNIAVFHANKRGEVTWYDIETTASVASWNAPHDIRAMVAMPAVPNVVGVLTIESQFMAIDCRSPRNSELVLSARSRPATTTARHPVRSAEPVTGIWGSLSGQRHQQRAAASISSSTPYLQHEVMYDDGGDFLLMNAVPMNTRPSVLLYSCAPEVPAQLVDMHAGKAMACRSPECSGGKFSSDDSIFYCHQLTQVRELRLDGRPLSHESAASARVLLELGEPGEEVVSFDVAPDNATIVVLDSYGCLSYLRAS